MKLRLSLNLYRFLLSQFRTVSYTVSCMVSLVVAAEDNGTENWDLVVQENDTVVLDTVHTYTDGILLEQGATLYLGCDDAAGAGNINLEADKTTLIINYRTDDVSFRTPSLENTLVVAGDTKITSGVTAKGETGDAGRLTCDWRTLTLSGGVTGSGNLSLYGYTYMVKPTTREDRDTTFNYVSAIAVNEQNAVTADGGTPDRFTGTVYLKNEFNYQPSTAQEINVYKDKFVAGAVQLTLVDNVFSEATLNLTRDISSDRTCGDNSNKGGREGKAVTSDNILVLSESSQIAIKSLESSFLDHAFLFGYVDSNKYTMVTTCMASYQQRNERWHVRVVSDGYTNLVLEDNSDEVHVFSGSMGFAHSYVTPGQAYVHAPSEDLTNGKGGLPNKTIVAELPTNPGAGSLGVEQLSLEKRGLAAQYIHTAKLVNLSVLDGVLGFNNLSVSGTLTLAGASTLRLGVCETFSTGDSWVLIDGSKSTFESEVVPEELRTNAELSVGSGRLEVSATKLPAHGVLPTTSRVEGSINLTEGTEGSGITFNINGVMPATEDYYQYTLLDVSDTLTLWDSTDITFNFSNVSLASQYDANETYYLVSADAINVLKDSSGLHLSGRTVSLGSGYYGKLDIITGKDKREYLAMNVVGDPRRTWSGMLANDYIWKHTEDKNDTPNALWKENRCFENGLLVLFGNLYRPEAWVEGSGALLDSAQTVRVTAPLHGGNAVQASESGFAIDGVAGAAVGYQKVEIVGEVAPASIVIGANYTLDGASAKDATNYYFYGSGTIREASESELHEAFKGGETSLTKMGKGTAVIATNNSFEGGTVLEGGRIVMQRERALGTGQVYVVNGAVLQADFADNSEVFSALPSFNGEQMQTTVVRNRVRTSVYVDPSAPDYINLVDARISNAHDKKMVLTYLEGGLDTVVTLYGHSNASGQYSYAVFKVLNPTGFSGTVKMDGNLTGSDVFRDLWDGDATNNVAGGKVQMEIMTTAKALDANGGNWLNTTIDLSVENGTERTVLALDALGDKNAASTQIAQVNALHGTGKDGKRMNSSVLSMSEEKAVTLQILGTVRGDYDGVLGFGDFQKTVDYTDAPSGIGLEHHHYGRAGGAGTLNVLKEGNVTQSVNSAWLNELKVTGGSFVVDEALAVRSIETTDANHLVVGTVHQSYPHTLVVGMGGILAIDSDASVDAFAGIGAGIPKRTEELIVGGEITTHEVAPEKFILFANGATITAFNDWMTDAVRHETINGESVDIPVTIEFDTGATVTFNTHNYTPDASINEENDEFERYNKSHTIQLLGEITGTDVNLIFNNELISAAAQAAGMAKLREDGLGYTGAVGEELGYVLINNHNDLTGHINVLSNTVLQVLESGAEADMNVRVAGSQAAMQLVEAGGRQYVQDLALSQGGALLLGGTKKTSLAGGDTASSVLDYVAEGIQLAATNRYAEQDGHMTHVYTDLTGTAVRIGGSADAVSEASGVHISTYVAGVTHEVENTHLRNSVLQINNGANANINNNVYVDVSSVVCGTAGSAADEAPMIRTGSIADFAAIAPVAAQDGVNTSSSTTVELSVSGGTLYSDGSKGIYHVVADQLQNINVEGTGLQLQFAGENFMAAASKTCADYVAVQIAGAGQFLYELDGADFSQAEWILRGFDGSELTYVWVDSSVVEDYLGVAVSPNMLYFVVIPEPATATLSLLALAALAARRRR